MALTEGFRRGSLVAAGFSIVAAVVAGLLLRRAERAVARDAAAAPDVTDLDVTDLDVSGNLGGDRPVPAPNEV